MHLLLRSLQVRNRLDRRLYAVKKVKMRVEAGRFKEANKKRNARLRREVLSLSRLENRFCCRYYQAWVEGGSEVRRHSIRSEEERSYELRRRRAEVSELPEYSL